MALLGNMVNSRKEWNIDYLHELREKFLQQEYPMELINEQFARALSIERLDLLKSKPKSKKKVISPLVITYNPGNPNFRKWIGEEINLLHEDDELKKIFPTLSVVTRQAPNIKKKVIKSKYSDPKGLSNKPIRPTLFYIASNKQMYML